LADVWLDYTATSDQTRGSAIAEEPRVSGTLYWRLLHDNVIIR